MKDQPDALLNLLVQHAGSDFIDDEPDQEQNVNDELGAHLID